MYTRIMNHKWVSLITAEIYNLAESRKGLKIIFLWNSIVLLILDYNILGLNYGEWVLQQAGQKFFNTTNGLHIMICHPIISSFFITMMNMNMRCREAKKVLLFANW